MLIAQTWMHVQGQRWVVVLLRRQVDCSLCDCVRRRHQPRRVQELWPAAWHEQLRRAQVLQIPQAMQT